MWLASYFREPIIPLVYFMEPFVGAIASLLFLWVGALIPQLFLLLTFSFLLYSILFTHFHFRTSPCSDAFLQLLVRMDIIFVTSRVLFAPFSPLTRKNAIWYFNSWFLVDISCSIAKPSRNIQHIWALPTLQTVYLIVYLWSAFVLFLSYSA